MPRNHDFGEDWGWGASRDDARKLYEIFREAGGNFIDTANVYTNGSSESLLGEFMAGFPYDFLEKPMVRSFTFGGLRDRIVA